MSVSMPLWQTFIVVYPTDSSLSGNDAGEFMFGVGQKIFSLDAAQAERRCLQEPTANGTPEKSSISDGRSLCSIAHWHA
jgi:hypothetical protein